MVARHDPAQDNKTRLIEQVGAVEQLEHLRRPSEEAWIEVIQKMDEVYADLVRSQIELEKKHAALEDAQRFIRSVLSSMTDVLIVCDINGNIQQINSPTERLTGRTGKLLEGCPLISIVSKFDIPTFKTFFQEVTSGSPMADCELSLLSANGEAVELAVNGSPRYDQNGKLVGIVLIGRPLGELRRAYAKLDAAHHSLQNAQQRLISSEKMAALGRLVAGVAHELNNPISFVFGNMHALKRYGASITKYLKALDSGLDEAQLKKLRSELKIDRIISDISPLVAGTLEGAVRVSEIVQDLRCFSSGQKEEATEFDLTTTVHTAVEWVSKTTSGKPYVEFGFDVPIVVSARRGYVHQIIVNLVQNAFDVMANKSEPKIFVDAGNDSTNVWVAVRDFGPGISEQDLPRIFEPFFTTKPVGQGTGMGLYVSYGMAEELGGTLTAENHPKGGAIFTLKLPREN